MEQGRYVCSAMDGGKAKSCQHDKTKINQILLRFRPIAPKPVAAGFITAAPAEEKTNAVVSSRRSVRRKYVRARKNKKSIERKLVSATASRSFSTSYLTTPAEFRRNSLICAASESWTESEQTARILPLRNPPVSIPVAVVETWVTVECVREWCTEGQSGMLGSTDLERITNLEADACPGFVSDTLGTVQWANESYKKMVMTQVGLKHSPPVGMRIWLVVKENPGFRYPAFTCRARLQCTWQKVKCSMMVLPCDVWRLDGGGFAWRLDVRAALSLSL